MRQRGLLETLHFRIRVDINLSEFNLSEKMRRKVDSLIKVKGAIVCTCAMQENN